MPQKIWVSNTGDMNSAASYSPSGVPVNGDDLFFVGSRNGGSDTSATSNVTALVDVNLGTVRTLPDYPGNLGTVGTYAEIGSGTSDLIHQGTGAWYVGDGYTLAPVMAIDSTNKVLAASINKTGMSIYARRGHTEILSGVSIELFVNTYGDSIPSVELKGTSGNLNNCWIDGGLITSSRSQAANTWIHLARGTWIQESTGGGLTEVSLTGGTLIYNTTGTLSYCLLLAGTLDFTQDHRAKTVTTLNILGGEMLDTGNVTVTPNDMTGPVPIL